MTIKDTTMKILGPIRRLPYILQVNILQIIPAAPYSTTPRNFENALKQTNRYTWWHNN